MAKQPWYPPMHKTKMKRIKLAILPIYIYTILIPLSWPLKSQNKNVTYALNYNDTPLEQEWEIEQGNNENIKKGDENKKNVKQGREDTLIGRGNQAQRSEEAREQRGKGGEGEAWQVGGGLVGKGTVLGALDA